jgi:5S rRNA maturation endonuclease (ribonuclease M5)
MENAELREYLNVKGFDVSDLFKFGAVLADNTNLISGRHEAWVDTEISSPSGQTGTVRNIINYKLGKYKQEGCCSAIFVPIFDILDKFVGMSIRKMCSTNKHDLWFLAEHRKVENIFGYNTALPYAVTNNSIIITEGVYDAIALRKYGLNTSCALLGTHMSNLQFFLLNAVVDNVALCLDNDEAGNIAMNKIFNKFGGTGVNFYKVLLEKDPDEFMKDHTIEDFYRRIVKC